MLPISAAILSWTLWVYGTARSRETRMRSNTMVSSHQIVYYYNLAGNTGKVLDWLDSCYVYRDHDMIYAPVNPYTPEVKKHPRYIELLKKLDLPVD